MATSIADLLNARLNTTEKSNVVSAINEVNTKAIEHSGNTSIHITSDEKSKITLIKDGTTSVKGLVQLSDAINSTSTSLAATANAVKKAYDLANTANNKTYTPPTASTSAAGVVQLNDAVNSTSTSQAATANAAKKAYDLASGKYGKPSTGIPKSDLASDVQISLGKADAAETQDSVRKKIEQAEFKVYKSGKDSNGVFTVVEYKRNDGTLSVKSVLSGGSSPSYTTRTITYYASNGTTVEKTTTRALSYDADGELISEV